MLRHIVNRTKTMKKIITIIILIAGISAFSAEAMRRPVNYHKPGYWGNMEVLGGIKTYGGTNLGFSITNGACLGHGLAMGLGIGINYDVEETLYAVSIPVFLETKYSPFKTRCSPYVSMRAGISLNDMEIPGVHLSPAVGFDISRFSVFLRYGLDIYTRSFDIDIDMPDQEIELTAPGKLKSHTLSLGFAFNF